MHSLLLSIRPEHAKKIFNGTKLVELRRVKPRLVSGDTVLVYVSSPIKALIGGFEVGEVIEGSPDQIWEEVKNVAGITASEFQKYYFGTDKAYGIKIRETWGLDAPLDLLKLKTKLNNFHPPQSFRYMSLEEVISLGLNQACDRK